MNGNNVIEVFPKPAIDNSCLYLRNFNSTKVHIKIFDNRYRLVLKKDWSFSNSIGYEFNIEGFASGIYFIKIQTDNGVKFA